MRKYGLLLSSVLVLAIFFGGFFLFVIPSNRAAQNKYGFLILQTIRANFESKINAYEATFTNNIQHGKWDSGVDRKKMEARLKIHIAKIDDTSSQFKPPQKKESAADAKVIFSEIRDDDVKFTFSTSNAEYEISSNLYNILDGIIKKFTNDFFQHFLLIKINDSQGMETPIYRSEGLDLGDDIKIDTFLPASKRGFYPGISEISLGDRRYQVFYSPLSLPGNALLLCGFRDASEYQQTLNQVPIKFIFPIAVILFLLLITLPLIKLYIMDRGERITFWDFAGFAFSLFIGTMFIANVIIQAILLKESEIKIRLNLRSLSEQIDSSFHHELELAYQQLGRIDSLARDTIIKDFSDNLICDIAVRNHFDTLYYYNFDRIAWTDDTGAQIMKGQLDRQPPVYTPVGERKFFRDFRYNNTYRLNNSDSLLFTIEPVFSWVDGSFRYIIAKRSLNKKAFITQISTQPYSFSQASLPPGFGFCIIDNNGEVQVHSDSLRNLNENFFDEVTDSRGLRGAVAARQIFYRQDLKFYANENTVLVKPIKGLPLNLIVFYDNGHVVPVNMRILTFSLIFSLIFILIYALFLSILFLRRHPRRTLLFTGFDVLQWLLPNSKYSQIYQASFFYILAYIFGVLAISLFTNTFLKINNHALIVLLFQTPVNIPLGIFIIASCLEGPRNVRPILLLIALAIFHLLYLLFSFKARDIPPSLIAFDLILNLLMAIIYSYPNWLKKGVQIRGTNYFLWYCLLVEIIVISLSVLPASLFSYYAYNQEILQGIKKNQLHIANDIESRKNGIYGMLEGLGSALIPERVIDTLKFRRGIYTVDKLKIDLQKGNNCPDNQNAAFDRFYFQISDEVSGDYYKTNYLPALRDHSVDRLHNWIPSCYGDSLTFTYVLKADTAVKDPRTLYLESAMPERYSVLNDKLNITIIGVLVVTLLLALYFIIRQILRDVFLKKYLIVRNNIAPIRKLPYYTEYLKQRGVDEISEEQAKALGGVIILPIDPTRNEDELDMAEHRILENMMKWKDYYEFVMSQCNPNEKRLLFNLARTGFINYKDSAEIHHLIHTGVLRAGKSRIRIFSLGLQAYLLKEYSMEADPAMTKILKRKSSWESFKRPFLIVLTGFACLVFFTQQEAWQRISALLAALGTSVPALLNMFRSGKSGK